MSQPNNILQPRLVAADSHTLSVVDDYIQRFSDDFENLSMALNTVIADDPASNGVLVAVRTALLANSEKAVGLSEGIMEQLILLPELEVNPYE
ncbi:hypothetical protein [Psychrobacter sp. LV10R520-6]|uniref:hypothetical protein n=1 Tax=Psychrobacter sp. LV10R520-6 TaxID=1415574 RepID=UPI0024CA9E75|nr:hypothetical protein [Psychrobacter sp. LV10R520-6]SNT69840.1 hypothetical protein SAMN04488491_0950 [Psychrobacter sp. LV10R520-6]